MNVAIIGGGAAGLTAAVTAAENGHRAVLFERQARVGRKLLATGNGRCNLTNTNLSLKNYHGDNPEFAGFALAQFPPQGVIDFFESLGLITVTEPCGRVYPFSDQAGSVLDVLRFAAEERGVDIRISTEISKISRLNEGFCLSFPDGTEPFERIIICCGGIAGGKLGGTKSGYELLSSLGHSRTKLYPSLVQLKTDTTFVRSLKGVRADGEVKIFNDGGLIAHSAGEIQFTEFGLSGPAVFEISRAASSASGDVSAQLDLMRNTDNKSVINMISRRVACFPSLTLENLLTGMLHNRLGRTIIRSAGYELAASVSTIKASDIEKIAEKIKCFSFPVIGTPGFDGAQVTAGGISTAEFRSDTMESRLVPGLYAAGEVLDIDGDCGGYNLQWAWASGRLAGKLL